MLSEELLLKALTRPLELSVTLTDSNKVRALEAEVERLRAELSDWKSRYNRVEYLYRCETLISLEIIDYCREHGLKLPRRLLAAPGSFDKNVGTNKGSE